MNKKDIDKLLMSILSEKGLNAKYDIGFVKEAYADLHEVQKSGHLQKVLGALLKISVNPLTKDQGGYGEPLGNKYGFNLTGCSAVKIKGKASIRIAYKVIQDDSMVKVLIIGVRRDDNMIYKETAKRLNKLLKELEKE
ncbi:MAG: hypothetical protein KAX49_16335 [Halanaerobiales bacterium]|nr:hypothetical protein [Halanaerobiales bacterium]